MRTIQSAHTAEKDAILAAQEFHDQVAQPGMALVLFFCSSHYDLNELGARLKTLFDPVPVVGCTTAGEIGPLGYKDASLCGMSFPEGSFSARVGLIGPLDGFEISEMQRVVTSLKRELPAVTTHASEGQRFAITLVDGLSGREEPLIGALSSALGSIPVVGGSAGDDLQFSRTWVYHDGVFHSDHALVVLMDSDCPVATVKSQHFVATDERMVITEADPARRRVMGINGMPAAEEYARLVGVAVNDLDPDQFALSPVVVLVNGEEYVRSIRSVNTDNSLNFYCAIEEGVVIRLARGVDLPQHLEKDLARLCETVGEPQAVFACDCVLRNREVTQNGMKDDIAKLMGAYGVVGFSSYGEQIGSVHVNQTFTALAIGQSGGS